ncbi:MFS general substrate transporter [Viridothelium virens]|uniref:MFS general substrate transporter n=1 Tax=Viridothelium virens TaxID=1048519 RepID=A0A6A6HDL4_VIRVR|nr:MFS general substrate transporter [Viridothelium virens]
MTEPNDVTAAGEAESLVDESHPVTSSPEIPDGGLLAWLQVLGAFCLYLNTWGIVSMFGAFQSYYQTTLLVHEKPDNISWIGSVQVFLLFLGGTLSGPAFDAGYLRTLLILGTFLSCFGMFMTSICQQYWQFLLAQGLVVGLGFGCLFLPTIAIISQYFTTKKAIAFGIASVGGSLGGVVFPIMFRRLELEIGFPWATRAIAFIMLGTLAIPLLTMRHRAAFPITKLRFVDLAAYRKPSLTTYVAGLFFGFMGVYVAMYYIQLYAIAKTGISDSLSSYLLPILNGTSIIGRLVSNYFADKAGPLNMQIPNAFAAAILCFCWIRIDNVPGIVVFAALYGIFIGSFNSLPGISVVSLSPNLSKVGLQLGVSFVVAGLGCLIGEPIAGAILRSNGGWAGLQAWCGVLLALFGALTLLARVSEAGLRLKAKA